MKKLLAGIFFLIPSITMASDLMVMDAWIPLAPPAMKSHAAYMMMHNHGDLPRKLIGVESEKFMMAHVHLSEEKDGVATMSMLHEVEIPAGGMLMMQPGSFHVMLMGPKSDLKLGDVVPLTLKFANGETIDVKAVVKTVDASS